MGSQFGGALNPMDSSIITVSSSCVMLFSTSRHTSSVTQIMSILNLNKTHYYIFVLMHSFLSAVVDSIFRTSLHSFGCGCPPRKSDDLMSSIITPVQSPHEPLWNPCFGGGGCQALGAAPSLLQLDTIYSLIVNEP